MKARNLRFFAPAEPQTFGWLEGPAIGGGGLAQEKATDPASTTEVAPWRRVGVMPGTATLYPGQ